MGIDPDRPRESPSTRRLRIEWERRSIGACEGGARRRMGRRGRRQLSPSAGPQEEFVDATVVTVPEPSLASALMAGIALLAWLRSGHPAAAPSRWAGLSRRASESTGQHFRRDRADRRDRSNRNADRARDRRHLGGSRLREKLDQRSSCPGASRDQFAAHRLLESAASFLHLLVAAGDRIDHGDSHV